MLFITDRRFFAVAQNDNRGLFAIQMKNVFFRPGEKFPNRLL